MPPIGSSDRPEGLPRSQNGANPQHLMAALLGDYWLDRDEHLPSATLVDVVREFDVTTASARAALSRLLRRGTLVARKSGRNTFYRLSDGARERLREARSALTASTEPAPQDWDGSWLVIAFSVAEDRREVRHALRSALRRNGFGPLYDGVWASPTADVATVTALLAALEVDQATLLRSTVLHPSGGPGHPAAVWDLDGLAAALHRFCATYEPVLDALGRGDVRPADALRHRYEVVDAWRTLVDGEPVLPAGLLPEGWPRARATEVLVRLLDGLAEPAEQRFSELVAREAPDLAPLSRANRISAVTAV